MNGLIFLYLLLISPKLVFDRMVKGKKHPGLLQRLGFDLPSVNGPVIWIHAVSVGEVKAAAPLFTKLKEAYPGHFFLVTTTSATGQAEAKRSLSKADAYSYLPIDLSWVARRFISHFRPEKFILIESDFWPNLLRELKRGGAQITLASGKMSERSARRFSFFSYFSKNLFSLFDLLCVQSEEHYDRFFPLVLDKSKLHISGNLKLDMTPQRVDLSHFSIEKPIITISCTHAHEEEMILSELIGGDWYILLAPRHPERFIEVATLLKKLNISFTKWSDKSFTGEVLLVDTMGQLPTCYGSSRLVIMGGSYVKHIGGHNMFEPLLYGAPVIFGPFTYGQTELVNKASNAGSGICVPIESLREFVGRFFESREQEDEMKKGAEQLMNKSRGAADRIFSKLT